MIYRLLNFCQPFVFLSLFFLRTFSITIFRHVPDEYQWIATVWTCRKYNRWTFGTKHVVWKIDSTIFYWHRNDQTVCSGIASKIVTVFFRDVVLIWFFAFQFRGDESAQNLFLSIIKCGEFGRRFYLRVAEKKILNGLTERFLSKAADSFSFAPVKSPSDKVNW